ncbi:MAG: hypothetical protein ACP5U0_09670 [Caldisphaera sp.]
MPISDPVAEAKRILETAEKRGVIIRLLGGVAFYFRCPSAKLDNLRRNYVDIDVIGHLNQSKAINRLFSELNYVPRERFNAMNGDRRLIFNDLENQRRVDVFLDLFEMCHQFDFKDRLTIDRETLSLADLLLTKLQIIEINEKDIKDILSLLLDYNIGNSDLNMINGSYIAKLCSNDWGIYKTLTLNLDKIITTSSYSNLDPQQKELIKTKITQLRDMIEETPKSLKWKMRAKIGEKSQWYKLPEADREVIDSRLKTTNYQVFKCSSFPFNAMGV